MGVLSSILWTTNAKLIGSIYLTSSLAYGITGLALSWIMRAELAGLSEQVLFGDHQLYNTATTSAESMLYCWWCGCMLDGRTGGPV